jgi:hypothetical protein
LGDDVFAVRSVADNRVTERETIDEDVVDQPSLIVGHHAVLDLVDGEAGDLVRGDALKPG